LHRTPTGGISGRYDDYRQGYALPVIDYIRRQARLKAGGRVLDLACGTGLVLRDFLGRYQVTGCDFNPVMLRQALRYRRQDPTLLLVAGDGCALPFRPEIFDLVTIAQAIHWFDLERLIPEVRQVLKPGGTLAVLSKYPDPAEDFDQLAHFILSKHRSGQRMALTHERAVGSLLGIEQAGFVNYRRKVIPSLVEKPLQVWLDWVTERGGRSNLKGKELSAYRQELENEMRARIRGEMVRERYYNYVITANRPTD
jgi:ubiquinone/menaquinone biosynthesis C-methylase UbiE